MMLDVKAIENPWSAKKKRILYLVGFIFFVCLVIIGLSNDLQQLLKLFATTYMSSLVFFSSLTYEDYIKKKFYNVIIGEESLSKTNIKKTLRDILNERIELWQNLCNSENLTEFFQLSFYKESLSSSYDMNNMLSLIHISEPTRPY